MSPAARLLRTPPADASNADRVRWECAWINRRDLAPVKRHVWAADIEVRFPGETVRGREEVGAYLERRSEALSDWQLQVLSVVGEGDEVFIRWRLTGLHTGWLFGVAPTGAGIALDGIDHFVFRDGRVVAVFGCTNEMDFARQVGVVPEDGTFADHALKTAVNTKTKVADAIGL